MNIRATYNGDVFRQLDEIFFYTNAGMRCAAYIDNNFSTATGASQDQEAYKAYPDSPQYVPAPLIVVSQICRKYVPYFPFPCDGSAEREKIRAVIFPLHPG